MLKQINFSPFQPVIPSRSPKPSGLVKDSGKVTVTKVYDFAGESVR